MAQHSHVPKFGNWDGENVPYTMYFENARKEKAGGAKMINPNDPEQNPDAFMCGSFKQESGIKKHREGRISLDKEQVSRDRMEGPTGYNVESQGISFEPQKSRHNVNTNSESSSDRSNSDRSLLQSNRRHRRSGLGKKPGDDSNSLMPQPLTTSRLKSTNTRGEELPQRVASVPKFGAWDETDPKSGEGFTVIFNKVKEEKHVVATNVPVVPTAPTVYSNTRKDSSSSPVKSKICCCFF